MQGGLTLETHLKQDHFMRLIQSMVSDHEQDQSLMRGMAAGYGQAIHDPYTVQEQPLSSYTLHLIGAPPQAEAVVQETLVVA
jgi:hypothetical protein